MFAAVVAACEAGLAGVTGDVGFDGDAVAGLKVFDGGVHGEDLQELIMGSCGGCEREGYLSSRFVAKDVFVFDDHRTDTAGMPEMNVGTVIGLSVQ